MDFFYESIEKHYKKKLNTNVLKAKFIYRWDLRQKTSTLHSVFAAFVPERIKKKQINLFFCQWDNECCCRELQK